MERRPKDVQVNDLLLEREPVFVQLRGAAAEVERTGRGAVVFIEGPAGIGKTRVLEAFVEQASGHVLRARGIEFERRFPFAVTRQLFEEPLSGMTSGARARLLSGAAALGLPAVTAMPSGSAQPDPPAVFHGLFWLVSALAGSALTLVVDDLHWVDDLSLDALAYLGHRIADLPVLLVVAIREGDEGAARAAVSALRAAAGESLILLDPLSEQAVGELVRAMLEGPTDTAFVEACEAATRGNPLLVHELIRSLREQGITSGSQNIRHVTAIRSASLTQTVNDRILRLGDDSLAVARAVAIAEEADLHHLEHLTGLGVDRIVEIADGLARARILEEGLPLRFTHPLVRTGVYERYPPAARATAHAEMAQLLHQAGAPSDHIAAHLLKAPARERSWRVPVLRDAAADALARGVPSSAVMLLRRALAEPPPADQRDDLTIELGIAESRAGEPEAIRTLREPLSRGRGTRSQRMRGWHELSVLASARQDRSAIELLKGAVEEAREADRDTQLAIETSLATMYLAFADASAEGDERLRRIESDLQGYSNSERALLLRIAFLRWLRGATATSIVPLLRRVYARDGFAGVPTDEALASIIALIAADEFELAGRLLEDGVRSARANGSEMHFAGVSAARALWCYLLGMLDEAEADAATALAICDRAGYALIAPHAAAYVARVMVEQKRLSEAEALLARFNDELTTDPLSPFQVSCVIARGGLRLAQGRYEEAVTDLLRGSQAPVTAAARDFWCAPAVLALLRLGRRDEAVTLASKEVDRVSGGPPRVRGSALRSLGIALGGEEGLRLLHEAADHTTGSAAVLERARTLTELGSALRRSNQRAAAKQPLMEAYEIAARAKASALEETILAELAAAGIRPRRRALSGVDALTASELRIAKMAADGMTNTEIAQALFVTKKTVEKHLGAVFTKLQIDSRRRLATVLAP